MLVLFRHLLYRHRKHVKSAKHRNFTTDFFLFQHNKGTSRNTNLSKLSTKNKTCLSICMWPTLKCMNDLKIVLTFSRICIVAMNFYALHFKVRLLTVNFLPSPNYILRIQILSCLLKRGTISSLILPK